LRKKERKMKKKAIWGIMLVLLLISMLSMSMSVIPVKAEILHADIWAWFASVSPLNVYEGEIVYITVGYSISYFIPQEVFPQGDSVGFYLHIYPSGYMERFSRTVVGWGSEVGTWTFEWNTSDVEPRWYVPYLIIVSGFPDYRVTYVYGPIVNVIAIAPPPITATVDITPDTLNLESEGQWITAHIQLPEGYNAADINASTILLNRTISAVSNPKYDFVADSRKYLVDHNKDGILERMVKFDLAEVMTLLSVGEAKLTISGEAKVIRFEGSDTIRVIDE
jgi:hypothetical protein